MVEFRALGSLAVVVDGEEASIGGPRQRRLLAMLLIHRDDVVSVDRLADAVFAGEPTAAARTTMRSYIARIRRVIGDGSPATLITKAPGYSLRPAPGSFDVTCFEQQLEAGRRHLAGGDAALAVAALRAALSGWSGPAYAEFADEEWAFVEAQRLEELRLVAYERLVDAELACGRASDTVALLDTLVVDHPLRESFRAQQVLALYRAGRQVDALRACRTYRQTLADELGLDPSPALVELERRILGHDPSLDLVEAAGEPLRGYRLGRRLGVGPNGTMFVATVAGGVHARTISILTDPAVDDARFVQSFETNAQSIASLTHPAVVRLHDYWRQPGTAYLVSRRPTGPTLRERLDRSPLTRDELVTLATRVAGALGEAASRGIEHGWITLDNVVDDGGWAITNFVVYPRVEGDDVTDLAGVLRVCVERLEPALTDAVRAEVDDVLARPGRAVADLVDRFTRALAGGADAAGTARPNPFKGLRAFDEADAQEFHGRSGLVAELLDRVAACGARGGLTVVVGGSGSGKSSIVRAGVIPAVRHGALGGDTAWYVATMLPGSAPFKELVEAMSRIAVTELDQLAVDLRRGVVSLDAAARRALPTGGRLLLVVDQFEELFTLADDDDQVAFANLLADAAEAPDGVVHVLATLRADFYDRPLGVQRFGALVGSATVVVPAMSPSELEAAIVRPVEAIGASAEPALVAELVAATTDQAAALPALQFTLFELAERHADRALTMDGYRELGGLDQAIASRAEGLYRSLDERGRAVVRTVFERLVVVDPDAEPTGRRSGRADLAVGDDAAAVHDMVERWTSARLLSGDHDPRTRLPTVQVAHEALLRSWPRLRQWIDDDRDAIAEAHRRREAAAEWVRMERDDGALYRGARLDTALELAAGERERLPQVEREFLAASEALRAREEHETADRLAGQERANRRLRLQVALIAVALVAAVVVGFVAVDQRNAAVAARRDARARELASAAEANVDVDPERAIHLALLAVETTRGVDGSVLPEAVDALHHAVTSSRVLLSVAEVGGKLDWDPTGDRFVTEGPEESGIVDIRDARTGTSVRSWRGDDVDVNEVRYSPDGRMLAVAGDDGVLKVFDPATAELIAAVPGVGSVWDPSFTADGDVLLAQWTDEKKVRAVDPATGEILVEVGGVVNQLAISPDGRRVAVINFGGDGGVAVLDATTLEPLVRVSVDGWLNYAQWRPDGTAIALGGSDAIVRVVDAETGDVIGASAGHTAPVAVLAWSRDGTRLATGAYDGTARVWDFDGSILVERLRVQLQDFDNGVAGVAFSPDGERLAVADWTIASTKIIDLRDVGGAEVANLPADPELGVAFLGDEIATGSPTVDGPVQVVDATTGLVVRVMDQVVPGWPGFTVSSSGTRMAVATRDASAVELRDLDGGSIARHAVADGTVEAIAVDALGEHFAYATVVDDTSMIVVLDASGRQVASRRVDEVFVPSISFGAEEGTIAYVANRIERHDPRLDAVVVWDWRAGEDVGRLGGRAGHVAFDPSGRYLATTMVNDGRIELFDATTLEPVRTLSGSTSPQSAATFDRRGDRLATGGIDGDVRVWDTSTGEELVLLPTPGTVFGLAFDDRGDRLVTLDQTWVARVWMLEVDALVDIARSRLTRELTAAECERYLRAACPEPV